jgi:Glycerophosphoryl diester phosphodiesterase family
MNLAPRSRSRRYLARVLRSVIAALLLIAVEEFKIEAEIAIFGQRPILLYAPFSNAQPVELPPVLLIAHNAGDQDDTTRRALRHRAEGIEIDVMSLDGRLYASHSAPSSWLPVSAYHAPRLGEAWKWSRDVSVVKLDLKSTSDAAIQHLAKFLENHRDERQIIVVSTSREALETIGKLAPFTVRMLSISNSQDLTDILDAGDRPAGIDGVSVADWLLTAETIERLQDADLLIDVWVVNDLSRLAALANQGVDSVTTDNLALLDHAGSSS